MKQLALLVVMGSASVASAQPYDPLQFYTCPTYTPRASGVQTSGSTVPTVTNPWNVVFSPDGNWVFVARANGIQVFRFYSSLTIAETTQSLAGGNHDDPDLTIPDRQFTGLAFTPDGTKLVAAAQNPVGHASHVVIFDVSQLDPAVPNAHKVTSTKLPMPGSHPGSMLVRTDGQHAWITNEYNNTIATLDVAAKTIDPAMIGTWNNPVGMAFDAQLHRLFVSTERVLDNQATYGIDPQLGSIEMFDVSGGTPVYHDVRNGGCGPARLHLDGQGRLFDSARDSNAVFVFDANAIWTNPNASGLVGYAVTGPKPLDTAFASNGTLLLVANSNRADSDGDGDPNAPGSMMSFRHSEIASQWNPAPVHWYSSASGLFSRQIAVHGQDVFMTNYKSANMQYFVIP